MFIHLNELKNSGVTSAWETLVPNILAVSPLIWLWLRGDKRMSRGFCQLNELMNCKKKYIFTLGKNYIYKNALQQTKRMMEKRTVKYLHWLFQEKIL